MKCSNALIVNLNIFPSFSNESLNAFKNTIKTLPSITHFYINLPKISPVINNSHSGKVW